MKPSPSSGQPAQVGPKKRSIDALPALFLAVAVVCLPVVADPDAETFGALSVVFISIVLEAIPFMLIGSLVGGLIEAFISRERLVTLLPQRGWPTVCIAAGLGLIFPVCECAVVPVVRRLLGKGLPLPAAIAYLLGGPIVNPIVASSTALAYAFDWRIVLLRLVCGYTLAVAVALVMGRLFDSATALKDDGTRVQGADGPCGCADLPPVRGPETGGSTGNRAASGAWPQPSLCTCGQSHIQMPDDWVDKAGAAVNHAMDDFLAVGHYLIIGAFIAALAQTGIERSVFLDLTSIPFLTVGLMMALAILLNLCSEADAFIAASFQGLITLPAQLAFMLTGPTFDLKLLLMYQGIFKRKAIAVLAGLILTAVLVMGAGLEWLAGGVL
jgi:uncharacterized membrane protein YraQ (UPF0718 family)